MKQNLSIFWIIFVWFLLSWCQSLWNPIQDDTEEEKATTIIYTAKPLSATISCDDHTINNIKDLWYIGNVISQGTGCIIDGIQHMYDVASLGVRIIFDNTISLYFLDQSEKPIISLQNNKIVYDKDHSLTVIKNYNWMLADYINDNFSYCDYDISDPVASHEYQIKCEWSDYLYFYNVSMIDKTIYSMQYAMWGQWFRFEIL